MNELEFIYSISNAVLLLGLRLKYTQRQIRAKVSKYKEPPPVSTKIQTYQTSGTPLHSTTTQRSINLTLEE